MTVVPVSKKEAVAVLRAHAANLAADGFLALEDEPVDRTIIHSFSVAGGMLLGADHDLAAVLLLGADHDLAAVLERVERADEVGWVDGPIRHDLCIAAGGQLYYYDVSRPGP